jgi:hypothetical protein
VSYRVNSLIISALRECPLPSRPPVRDKIGSEKDLWSEQISKIAKRFLRFARSSSVSGGEAAELHPEFTLSKVHTSAASPPGQKRAVKTQKSLCNFCVLTALKDFFAPVPEVGKGGGYACKSFR